jgi:hypothetical protein
MHKSRFALLSVLAVTAGGLLSLPTSSNAGTGTDRLDCAFSGQTPDLTNIQGIVRSEQGPEPGSSPVLGQTGDIFETNPAEPAPGGTDIETGSYTFPDVGAPMSTQCVHFDVDQPPNTGVRTASLSASGTYRSILCGTGSTDGTATLTVIGDPEIASITFNTYHIDFNNGGGNFQSIGTTGGVGPTGAGAPTTATVKDTVSAGSETHPAVVHGHVAISPIPVTPGRLGCVDSDAADFIVEGNFSVTETN